VSLAKVVTNRGYIGNERLGVTNGVENINTNETDRDAEPANCRCKSNRRLRLAAPPLKLHVPHASNGLRIQATDSKLVVTQERVEPASEKTLLRSVLALATTLDDLGGLGEVGRV